MPDAATYDASFPAAITDDAGRRFTRWVYRHLFGWPIVLAILVNLGGCAVAVAFSGWTTTSVGLAALVSAATAYFAVNWCVRPGVTSRRLQRAFGGGAAITLRPDGFDIVVGERRMSRPWGRQHAILEVDAYYLLPIAATMCIVLPREGMPPAGQAWVRAAMAGPMSRPIGCAQ